MARHIDPDSLKNLALDAVVKNYGHVLLRIFKMEENSPEWMMKPNCEILDSEEDDLREYLYVVKLKLKELKNNPEESPVKDKLTRSYEEIQEVLKEVITTVWNNWDTLAAKVIQQASNTPNERSYVPEICNKLHDIVKSALDFIHDQEIKSVELGLDQTSSSVDEHSLTPDRELCVNILKTVETVTSFISNIPTNFLMYFQSQPHAICDNLHCVIKNTIPSLLADKLTQKLFEYIQRMFKERSNLYYFCLKWECRRRTLSNLITAVMHPAVTTMDIRSSHHMICYVVCDNMSYFSNIVALKLPRLRNIDDPDFHPDRYYNGKSIDQMIVSGLQAMKNLQIFQYSDCTNDVLAALARNCKGLRCLNVKWSSNLNDDSVKSFAELRYLEEVNVIGTNICEGLADVINGMDQNEVTTSENKSTKSSLLLEKFTSYITLNTQVPLIVSKLHNIRQLKLLFLGKTYNFSDIKHLQFLKSLSLHSYCEFVDVEEILVEKGRQLLELKLKNVRNVDLDVVSVNCPTLTNLSLTFCSFNTNESQSGDVLLPELKKNMFL